MYIVNKALGRKPAVIVVVDDEDDDDDESNVTMPITVTLLIWLGYVLVGVAIFCAWEWQDWVEWEWFYVLPYYFNFITISTIGFGDYVPG